MDIGRSPIALAVSAMLLALPSPSCAQSSTSVRGTILDPRGAVVSWAEVTIANQETGFSRTVYTNDQGAYQFLEIPPNTYSLTIKASGFAAVRIEGVSLMVKTPSTINEVLKVQGGNTIVEVMDTPPLVNSQDASQGHAFDVTQIDNLPSEGRNPIAILSLQPGVVFTGSSESINPDVDSRSGAVSGARSDQTNVTIDGIDDNDQVRGYAFQGALRSTLDSLQEFRVITSNANAEAGRSSGAQVTLVTKSGSNHFHGTLYEYNRSSLGEANDWFVKQAELNAGHPNVAGHLVRNTFGAAIGGPIKKDRLFFFATYEGQRTRENTIVSRYVPSESFRRGLLSYQCTSGTAGCPSGGVLTLSRGDLAALDPNCSKPAAGFPGGVCPLGPGANPALLPILQSDPLPNSNLFGDGLNFGTYTFSAPAPAKLDTYILKLDYRLTSNGNHQLFIRLNLQNDHASGLQYAGPQFPGDPPNLVTVDNNKGIALGYSVVLRKDLINDFRYGFVRQGLGSIGLYDAPNVYLGFDAPHTNYFPTTRTIIPVHNWVDNLSWTRGKHTFQFGTNIRRIDDARQSNSQSFFFTQPNWAFLDFSAIAGTGSSLDPSAPQFSNLGLPAVEPGFQTSYDAAVMSLAGILPQVVAVYNQTKTLSVLPQGSYVPRHFRATEAEWYAQDSWTATSSLTLTFGARYTLLQPPYEMSGSQVAPTSSLDSFFRKRGQAMLNGQSYAPSISFNLAGQANGKPPYWAWDDGNIAPRFAFAWSPKTTVGFWRRLWGQAGQSSVRGGYGMYFDHFGEGVVNSFDRNGSFGLTTSIGNPAGILSVDNAPRFSGLGTVPAFAAGGCATPPCPLYGPPPQSFPVALPMGSFALAWGLDDKLKTPYSHVINFGVTRELPHNFVIEAAYIGRFAHRLIQEEDLAQPLDIRDPQSGTDYFSAARMFTKAKEAQVPIQNIAPIPYWEHLFPTAAGAGKLSHCAPGVAPSNPTASQNMYDMYSCWLHNETEALFQADVLCFPGCATVNRITAPYQFYDSQYSSLYAWRSIGNSSYNGVQFSLRHRAGGLEADVNYTFSKSMDIGSNAERINNVEGGGFASQIINAWMPNQLRSVSDFDTRHQINANLVYDLPFGKGGHFRNESHGITNGFLGGWAVSGLFRWTSGFPVTIEPGTNWSTNFGLTSAAVQTRPTSPTGAFIVNGDPNLFQNPSTAVQDFRFAYPGESGQRNTLRGPGYFGIDLGVGKTWNISESQTVKFSWETFNITNTTRFDVGSLQAFGNDGGGNNSFTNDASFGKFTSTLTKPRVMQFALRYSF
jgi:hypothetical protein